LGYSGGAGVLARHFQSQESVKELMEIIGGKIEDWGHMSWRCINQSKALSALELLKTWDSWEQKDGELCCFKLDELSETVELAISEWGESKRDWRLVEVSFLLEILRHAVMTKTITLWLNNWELEP
jgi:hypothetical protein